MGDNLVKARYQTVVYWERSGYNKYGEVDLLPPEELKVRIEKGRKDTLDSQGNLKITEISLTTGKDLVVGSLIWIGELANYTYEETVIYQVARASKVPTVNSRKYDRRAFLRTYKDRNPPEYVVHDEADLVHDGTAVYTSYD